MLSVFGCCDPGVAAGCLLYVAERGCLIELRSMSRLLWPQAWLHVITGRR